MATVAVAEGPTAAILLSEAAAADTGDACDDNPLTTTATVAGVAVAVAVGENNAGASVGGGNADGVAVTFNTGEGGVESTITPSLSSPLS